MADFIWYHENALRHSQAQYGVRLSFALGDWKDLSDVYPPALRALRGVKRRAEVAFRRGEGSRALFHDLASINRELKRGRDTYLVFRALRGRDAKLAKACADLAMESIVEAGDFKLATEFLPHPEEYLLWLSDRLNADVSSDTAPRRFVKMRRSAHVHTYCEDVRMAMRILEGLGHREAVRAAREWAVALVDSRQVRRMVREALAS